MTIDNVSIVITIEPGGRNQVGRIVSMRILLIFLKIGIQHSSTKYTYDYIIIKEIWYKNETQWKATVIHEDEALELPRENATLQTRITHKKSVHMPRIECSYYD